jgi:hypothetical protein
MGETHVAEPARFDPSTRQILVLIPAVLLLGAAIGGIDLQRSDFRIFYDASAAWRAGTSVGTAVNEGGLPNLNPPTLVVLMAPLTLLPLPVAFAVWTLLGLLAFLACARLIQSRSLLAPSTWIWVGLASISTMPFLFGWVLGQVTWVLMYLVTRAWVAGTPRRAGAWLGMAIAIKPPLALMALCLPAAIWTAAAACSLSITAAVVAATGFQPWLAWLAIGDQVRWLGLPTNLSLFGLVARFQTIGTTAPNIRELPLSALVSIALVALVLWRQAIRARGDRRWVLALLWSLFVSPAGWIYYLPLGLGPMLASWPSAPLLLGIGIACLAVPTYALVPFVDTHTGFIVVGLVYPAGAWLLWTAWAFHARPPGDADRPR